MFNITLTSHEMAIIQDALKYAATQVHDSDIPVFQCYEHLDQGTGKVLFDEALYRCNRGRADLALMLADTLASIANQ